jgi:acyl-CoA reductase-like NAD-dependent aldehyde dehydrogenase
MQEHAIQTTPLALVERVNADVKDLSEVFESPLKTVLAWRASTDRERQDRIKRLRSSLMSHRESMYDAFMPDLHKPRLEVEPLKWFA